MFFVEYEYHATFGIRLEYFRFIVCLRTGRCGTPNLLLFLHDIFILNDRFSPGYDVKMPGCRHPNKCVRLDPEGHRCVKTRHTKSHVLLAVNGQSLYPCMHGHFRLEQ